MVIMLENFILIMMNKNFNLSCFDVFIKYEYSPLTSKVFVQVQYGISLNNLNLRIYFL